MDRTPYIEFAKEKLGFEFNDIELLVTALTHRSYTNEHRSSAPIHNERLEFLGDAILEMVSSDFLYRNYNEPEGIMTAWRAALVRTESIGDAGEKLGYEPLVRLSHGEKNGSRRAREVILADCFEAVIGAIYLDQGFDTAKAFIKKHILTKIDQILEDESWRDPKSHLQELSQHFDSCTPVYKTIHESGPDHDKTFIVGAFINNELKGQGEGHSKQEAQTAAAKAAIKQYKSQNQDA